MTSAGEYGRFADVDPLIVKLLNCLSLKHSNKSNMMNTYVESVSVSFTASFPAFFSLPSGVGEETSSPPVKLGNHIWSVRIYPGGRDNRSAGHLSCYLALDSSGEVRAHCKISLLQTNGGAHQVTASNDIKTFSQSSYHGTDSACHFSALRNPHCFIAKDTLVIKVDLSLFNALETFNCGTISNQPTVSDRTLLHDIHSLVFNQSLSDITIKVGAEGIAAHKLVLCLRSEVFKAMLHLPMSESLDHVVEINDFEPCVVNEFLHFIYTDHCTSVKAMETHAEQLLAIACKYQVKGLETLCENHLCSTLTVDNIVSVLLLADMYSARHLKTKALEFIARTAKAVVQSEGFYEKIGFDLCQEVMNTIVGIYKNA